MSRRRAWMAGAALAAAVALAACGKKGPPEAPEGSTFPRTYPKPSSMVLEGDLLAPTKTLREPGGIRGGVDIYPDASDFPEDEGFDDTVEEEEVAPGEEGEDSRGVVQ